MRQFRIEVFDERIVGTATTWYTSADFNDQLGSADALLIQATTWGVTGTSPTLTCQVEHSGDSRQWNTVNVTPEINAVSISNGASVQGVVPLFNPVMLTYVRIRVAMGGTSPNARVKLMVTGRVSRAA